jgi:excisionase family DNA binding protein
MADRIVIPFGPEILVLTDAEFSVARDRGRAMAMPSLQPSAAPPPSGGDADLLTADQAALRFALPKSWLLEKARQDLIPHRRIGRYVRFSPAELAAWLAKPQPIAHRSNGRS